MHIWPESGPLKSGPLKQTMESSQNQPLWDTLCESVLDVSHLGWQWHGIPKNLWILLEYEMKTISKTLIAFMYDSAQYAEQSL